MKKLLIGLILSISIPSIAQPKVSTPENKCSLNLLIERSLQSGGMVSDISFEGMQSVVGERGYSLKVIDGYRHWSSLYSERGKLRADLSVNLSPFYREMNGKSIDNASNDLSSFGLTGSTVIYSMDSRITPRCVEKKRPFSGVSYECSLVLDSFDMFAAKVDEKGVAEALSLFQEGRPAFFKSKKAELEEAILDVYNQAFKNLQECPEGI